MVVQGGSGRSRRCSAGTRQRSAVPLLMYGMAPCTVRVHFCKAGLRHTMRHSGRHACACCPLPATTSHHAHAHMSHQHRGPMQVASDQNPAQILPFYGWRSYDRVSASDAGDRGDPSVHSAYLPTTTRNTTHTLPGRYCWCWCVGAYLKVTKAEEVGLLRFLSWSRVILMLRSSRRDVQWSMASGRFHILYPRSLPHLPMDPSTSSFLRSTKIP